jgi:hypothetical protein
MTIREHGESQHTPKLTIVDHECYPSIRIIKGFSFDISVVMSALDMSFDDGMKREMEMRFLVEACNSHSALIAQRDALREALEHFTVRPNFHQNCDDYSRGYGDALAVVATQAVSALKDAKGEA